MDKTSREAIQTEILVHGRLSVQLSPLDLTFINWVYFSRLFFSFIFSWGTLAGLALAGAEIVQT